MIDSPQKPIVSIIIRTKNEERWISSSLSAIYNQSYKDFEIILVDNQSTDKTIAKAKQFPIAKEVNIVNYLPGKALNMGIEKSKGKYIVCISAHCIPNGSSWLASLVNALEEDKKYAGVYGRQEPMSFSSASDKRDMAIVFGLDRKIQIKDSFFHNANSIIHRALWEKVPFDSETTNIEDRLWAQEMIDRGYKIFYEPESSVYHYHGIHQDGHQIRLRNVVNIIENQYKRKQPQGKLDASKLKILALIPVKGRTKIINGKPLLAYTIESARQSKYIDKVIVSTDTKETVRIAEDAGAECPFLRPANLSESYVSHEKIHEFSLKKIEETGYYPDLVVHLGETYPFRQQGMIDEMIEFLLDEGFDSVIAGRRESGFLWQEDGKGGFMRLDSGDVPREFKEKTFIGMHDLGCVTLPMLVRQERLLGDKIGIFTVDYPYAGFEVRKKQSAKLAAYLFKNVWEKDCQD
jgi:GT2 family glycosyltransferase|tara:strand:+ start:2484 stop:3872 length:1389 start_codon:yes stop_codon:yes gene_type:complete